MKRLIYALLLLVAPALLGAPFTLTNTRYGETSSRDAVLTTNGRDAFVLWKSLSTINMTRIVAGEYRVGRPVFNDAEGPDVVWTGQFFLAVATSGENVVGRLLDAQGEPAGGVFMIVEGGENPRIAFNGRNVLVMYSRDSTTVWNEFTIHATLLTSVGTPAGGGSVDLGGNAAYDVASNGNGFAVISAARNEVSVTTMTANGSIASKPVVSTFEAEPRETRSVAIASNGSGYLGVWTTGAQFDAVPVNADGTLASPFNIGRFEAGDIQRAAVAWSGSAYTAAFIGDAFANRRLRLARLSSHSLQATTDAIPASTAGLSLATVGGRMLMTWNGAPRGTLMLAEASKPEEAVPVTFAAAHQELGAAASLPAATLVTWAETINLERTLRAGIRSADRSWKERVISVGNEEALRAAADGTNFLLITRAARGLAALRIDAQANVLSRSAFFPSSGDNGNVTIAWNGQEWAVAYVDNDGKPMLARVTRTGVLSTVREFPARGGAERAVVVSDGPNFLFTWNDAQWEFCFFCEAERRRILVSRLGPGLTPIDAEPFVLADELSFAPDELRVHLIGTAARKERYEVYWMDGDQLIVQHVPRSGPLAGAQRGTIPDTEDLGDARWDHLHVSTSPGGSVAVWPGEGGGMMRFIFADFFLATAVSATRFDTRQLVHIPNGGLAWIGVDQELAPPHHGAQRLMMDFLNSGTTMPDAPRATLTFDGREMRIEWDAPAQPVIGYRVEYRIGDGNWNEFPRQFGAGERSATWTSIASGKSYAFRVRAFSENGAGLYSEPVRASVGHGKRRAVR